jgi:glycosidase
LVIYEINPYAFTSLMGMGNGGGSGTFRSMCEKLPYLKEIGITGIWLAGFSCSSSHFRGIPSVYTCITPDFSDPKLVTEDDLRY